MSSVKVAVRVRPFNKREIDMQCKKIIHMVDNKTVIQNPKVGHGEAEEDVKEFTFDHSYCSFDPTDANFASQTQVFEHLGKDIVKDAVEGYNSCIFAYGQTGSGKTHTMMGDATSEGLIPRICQWLFKQTSSKNNDAISNKTEISYLEIYNEQVRDLLDDSADINGNYRRHLKVREHPKYGPYVEKLSRHSVYSYEDIAKLMEKGNSNRTTASTSMNDTSSRSHAIFTIMFSKASFVANNPYETMSKINLVDLAGSERANSTNAQGARLVEGSHINKSLVTLGSVISTLAENCKKASTTKKKVFIPYRDSILTWLLKDSLGGNSKTVMVATLSPADCNYGETLNTLRYANRAKNILNKPHINEDANTKLIRELRSEIERLTSMMSGAGNATAVSEQLQESEAKMKELTEEWMNKWDEVQGILQEQSFMSIRKSGNSGVVLDSDRPHLIVCVDDDVLSTGVTLYHLNEGVTSIGTKFADTKQDIIINGGADVEDDHCTIHWDVEENVVTLKPLNKALCFVNNSQIDGPTILHQGCFIVFGENMFRFSNPLEVANLKLSKANGGQMDVSILSRSSHLVSSTSYDSMYTSINSLNKKALMMSSFTSTLGLNESESEAAAGNRSHRNSVFSDTSTTSGEANSEKLLPVTEELDFIKSFLLELQIAIKEGEQETGKPARGLMETFLEIVVKIGREEHFSKEKILQILSFINQLQAHELRGVNAGGTDEVAIQKMGDFLLGKLNLLKGQLKDEMKLDLMNNNEAASTLSNSTVDSLENGYCVGNGDEAMVGPESALSVSTYGHLCHLANEVDSNLALLSECVSQLNTNAITLPATPPPTAATTPTFTSTTTTTGSTQSLVSNTSTLADLSTPTPVVEATDTLEEMIESEVQRRLDMHLRRRHSQPTDSPAPTSELSFESNLNLIPKELLCSTPLLSHQAHHHGAKVQRSHSFAFDESLLDQIIITVPSSHYQSYPDEHYQYKIDISINGDSWTIYRRYRCFHLLHRFLKAQYGTQIRLPYFPPKRWNNMSEKVIEERRRYLENYLQKVLEYVKALPHCPLNYRARGLEHLDRFCLYNFNTFFCVTSLVDKDRTMTTNSDELPTAVPASFLLRPEL